MFNTLLFLNEVPNITLKLPNFFHMLQDRNSYKVKVWSSSMLTGSRWSVADCI